ncbi:hypothetical protein JOQ06_000548 [Pogonophryne albipinna]|uniref:Uncharacterized protein n=1 Tax=Pogonophryne albipinna TaxID=1090488 RepID=A0AAD6AGE0_9TELE|nr:hypothetical protein JOQ06_000548 [Pogonophryne albipinna]
MPAKQVKKDSLPTEKVATSDVSMEALTSLLESHKVSLSTEFKTVIAAFESKIDLVHATISDHGQRITSLESNADLVDGRLSTLEATCAELAASNAKLRAKTADLEARSRHNNIRIIGLPEEVLGETVDPSPLTALFGIPLMPNAPITSKRVIAFTTLLARRLILLKWIYSSPPTHNRWIHEILYCVRLERIRFSLRGALSTFHDTLQPFLDHIDTLTIGEEPNT